MNKSPGRSVDSRGCAGGCRSPSIGQSSDVMAAEMKNKTNIFTGPYSKVIVLTAFALSLIAMHTATAGPGNALLFDTDLRQSPYQTPVELEIPESRPQPAPPAEQEPQAQDTADCLSYNIGQGSSGNTKVGEYPPAEYHKGDKDYVKNPVKYGYPHRRNRITGSLHGRFRNS